MINILRLIFISFGSVLGLTLLVSLIIYYLASSSIPNYDRTVYAKNLKHSVKIIRDTHAIPYISAQNELDSMFALGYVHAQDRLWQMLTLRRTAQGRLSEIFGDETLQTDILIRSLDLYTSAQSSEQKQTPEIKKLLQAYSNGVNARLDQITKEGIGRGAPELFLYPPQISPWQPADSIAILKMLSLQFTEKAFEETLETQLQLTNIKPDRINDLLYNSSLVRKSRVKPIEKNFSKFKPLRPLTDYLVSSNNEKASLSVNLEEMQKRSTGSNIFAVGPERSATGFSLAASDPHLPFTAPSIFMLSNLNMRSGSVTGGAIPGIPAILVGRSEKLAWGFSKAYVDDQDLYIEKLNPKNQNQYLTSNGYIPFDVRKEIIRIRGKKGITITIKRTLNGPILPDNTFGINAIKPKGYEISLRWTGSDENDRTIESLISLMRAENISDAKQHLNLHTTPAQNIMLVDKKNIGIYTVGKIPKRHINHRTKGKAPSAGWITENKWLGYIDYNLNPFTENPASGSVVNTNNKTTNASFPNHVSFKWGDSQRIVRAKELLDKQALHTPNSFQEIQTDTISISARILLPLLAKNLWYSETIELPGKNLKYSKMALDLLANWNGDMAANDPEPLIYSAWIKSFQSLVIRDELGPIEKHFKDLQPLFLEKVLKNINGASEWCDIKQTTDLETCEEISLSALNQSIATLRKAHGDNLKNWRWGDVHKAIHLSDVFGRIPIVSFFSNIVQEISGGDSTLMLTKNSRIPERPYSSNSGSVLRAIFDFSSQNNSMFIISTGQSGHIFSRHYEDQSILWKQQRYIPLSLDPLRRRGGSIGQTIINPLTTN